MHTSCDPYKYKDLFFSLINAPIDNIHKEMY